MTALFRPLLALLLLLPLTLPLALAPAAAAEPGGSYRVEGRNPDGSSYSGTAEIAASGETFSVVWQVGNTRFEGTAILLNGVLAVAYNGGLAVYEQARDGRLLGTWAVTGGRSLGQETMTPLTY